MTRKEEYKATYDRLMLRASGREFIKGVHERHHVVPKSLGGSNDKDNIVCLTYREHFLAHWLLTKFTDGAERKKMLHALSRMMSKNSYHDARAITSWQYALSRKANAEALFGNEYAKGLNYSRTEEDCEEIRKRMIGNTNGLGTKRTDDFKIKQSERMLGNDNGKGNKGSLRLIQSLIGNKRAEGTKQSDLQKENTRKRMIGNKYGIGKNKGKDHPKARPVICKNDGKKFYSIVDASEYYGIIPKEIRRVCKGARKTAKGFCFEYIEEVA